MIILRRAERDCRLPEYTFRVFRNIIFENDAFRTSAESNMFFYTFIYFSRLLEETYFVRFHAEVKL